MDLCPVSVTFLVLETKLASWICLSGVLWFQGFEDNFVSLHYDNYELRSKNINDARPAILFTVE